MSDQESKRKGRLGLGALRPHFRLLRDQRLDLTLVLLLMLLSTGVSLAIPVIAGRFVDTINGVLRTVPERDQLLLLAGLLVLQLLGTFFFNIASARLGLRTVTRLRHRLFAHLLELPALYFSDQKAGDLSSRVTSDVGSIQYILTSGIVTFLRAVLTIIGALVLMFSLNPRLTTVVLLLIPATIGLVRLFGWRLQKLYRRLYDELGRISSHVQETAGGIRAVKVYNAQDHQLGRFDGMIQEYLSAGLRRAWLQAALESSIQISLWVCLLAVVIYGFTLTARGATTAGELVAFLLLAFRVAMPLGSLTNLYSSAQGAVAAAGRLDDIFALEPERMPGTPTMRPDPQPASLSLRGVSFRYPGHQDNPAVLRDIDLEIPAGSWVGIVGPSGAGKSTLAHLILGLLPPDRGQLALDGRPYPDFELTHLRARMAWVGQEPLLYDASLRDNILFGLENVDEQDLEQAVRLSGVADFAREFPAGIDTTCGEQGSRLSGGQRQKVALARAFLRLPGLLVLDEPTSALDAESEEGIRQAMRNLMRGRTALVIAHRLSLVRDLDQILVLDQGRIVEMGPHAELMAAGGLYKTLYDLQHGS
ncbi:hypothetical protein CSB20_08530 [bacterium DOLZORAL124_64_63]|nr:MAG: hypothetical protein CSB20_08530 [bacterium DOLZORAL124_64_63]